MTKPDGMTGLLGEALETRHPGKATGVHPENARLAKEIAAWVQPIAGDTSKARAMMLDSLVTAIQGVAAELRRDER